MDKELGMRRDYKKRFW